MKITAPMLLECLDERTRKRLTLLGSEELEIESVDLGGKLFPDTGTSQHYLYVVAAPQVEERPSKHNVSRMKNAVLVLEPGKNASDAHTQAELHELVQTLWASLVSFFSWESELQAALLADEPLSTFIKIGAEKLSSQFVLMDRNFFYRGASTDFLRRDDLVSVEQSDEDGAYLYRAPVERIANYVQDLNYRAAADYTEPFYLETKGADGTDIAYCHNITVNGEYRARFFLMVEKGERTLRRGEEQISRVLFEYLQQLFRRRAGMSDVMPEDYDALRVLIKDLCDSGEEQFEDISLGVIEQRGWKPSDRYIAVRFFFFENVSWKPLTTFVCRYLEQQADESCATATEESIAWVVNLSRTQDLSVVNKAVLHVIREYLCKAGLSDEFDSFTRLGSYLHEARAAYVLGSEINPHYWYFRFEDYAFEQLKRDATSVFDVKQLCHRGVLALRAYDESHGTELVETLRCYLASGQNATSASQKLFIHRVSLVRRLERIAEISGIDLSKDVDLGYLAISLELLGD